MRRRDPIYRVHSGKVLYTACSNYPAWLLCKALWTSDKLGLARFDCVQPRYNLLFRHIEAELLPLALDQGIGVISYNPLAPGSIVVARVAGCGRVGPCGRHERLACSR